MTTARVNRPDSPATDILGAMLLAVAVVLALADALVLTLPEPPSHVPLACAGNVGCPGDPADPLHRGTQAHHRP